MDLPLIGNKRTVNNLLAMIDSRRIPHAIILEGESGLGKKTLAKFISKALLCSEEVKPCLKCKNCHLIDVGSHPDYLKITPEGASIKVDQIRTLRSEAYLTPLMASGRVFVIEDAHTMNDNAGNALLKVLEEPPGNVTFILLCKSAALMLQTIRSRCVTFTLAPVPLENEGAEIVSHLAETDLSEALTLLTAADGNIGRAVEMKRGEVSSLYLVATELLTFAAEGNRLKILEILQGYSKKREQIYEIIAELKNAVGNEIKKKAMKELTSFTADRLNICYNELKNLETKLEFNPSIPLINCIVADILTSNS